MTREEAKKLIFSQWQSFLEDYIDYGGISEAYKMALKALEQDPCEDAISREAAIKAMNDLEQEDIEQFGCSIPEGFDGKRAIEALQSLPSVIPNQEMGEWTDKHAFAEHVKREKGEDVQTSYMPQMWFCNRCWMPNNEKNPFCPHCGAKMGESPEGQG